MAKFNQTPVCLKLHVENSGKCPNESRAWVSYPRLLTENRCGAPGSPASASRLGEHTQRLDVFRIRVHGLESVLITST